MTSPRLFTLDQASAIIPVVEPLLRRLQEKVREFREKQSRIESLLTPQPGGNGHHPHHAAEATALRADVQALAADLEAGVREVQSHGCEVKDVENGLIDFRSLREDRVVYLCWRLGETDIRFFHELDAGFAGRQPL